MIVCSDASWAKAAVDGRGMHDERLTSMGSSSSIASASGAGESGERSGKVRLCSCRVWWVRWVVRAEWAVINLFREKGAVNTLITCLVRMRWVENEPCSTTFHTGL